MITQVNAILFFFSGSTSPCEDTVVSGLAASYKEDLWFKNDIYVSFDACSRDNIYKTTVSISASSFLEL